MIVYYYFSVYVLFYAIISLLILYNVQLEEFGRFEQPCFMNETGIQLKLPYQP